MKDLEAIISFHSTDTSLTSWVTLRVKAGVDHLRSSENKERRWSHRLTHESWWHLCIPANCGTQPTSQPTCKAELLTFRTTLGSLTELEAFPCLAGIVGVCSEAGYGDTSGLGTKASVSITNFTAHTNNASQARKCSPPHFGETEWTCLT